MPFIDPSLQQALDGASGPDQVLQAVFVLRASLTGDALQAIVDGVFSQAAHDSGQAPLRRVLFSHIGAVAVEAPVGFIQALAAAPAISAAMLNLD